MKYWSLMSCLRQFFSAVLCRHLSLLHFPPPNGRKTAVSPPTTHWTPQLGYKKRWQSGQTQLQPTHCFSTTSQKKTSCLSISIFPPLCVRHDGLTRRNIDLQRRFKIVLLQIIIQYRALRVTHRHRKMPAQRMGHCDAKTKKTGRRGAQSNNNKKVEIQTKLQALKYDEEYKRIIIIFFKEK